MLPMTHTKPYLSSLFSIPLCSLSLLSTCYLSIFYLCSFFFSFLFLLAYFTYFHPSYPCAAPLRPLIIQVSLYTQLNEHFHCLHSCRCILHCTNHPHHHHPNSCHHPV